MDPETILAVPLPDTLGIQKVHRHRAKMHLTGKSAVEVLGEGGDPRILAPLLAVLGDESADVTDEVEGDMVLDEARVVHGNMTISGNLDNQSLLVVTGDLSIGGSYVEDQAQLLVGGSMEVEHMLAQSEILVLGDLTARGLVWVWNNDHSLLVGKTLTTPVLVRDDHEVRYARVSAGFRFDKNPGDDGAALFAPDVMGEEGIDLEQVEARVRAGDAVLADPLPRLSAPLPLRVTQLLRALDTATAHEWTEVGGRPAMRVVAEDGSRQISVLTPEEKEALETELANRGG